MSKGHLYPFRVDLEYKEYAETHKFRVWVQSEHETQAISIAKKELSSELGYIPTITKEKVTPSNFESMLTIQLGKGESAYLLTKSIESWMKESDSILAFQFSEANDISFHNEYETEINYKN